MSIDLLRFLLTSVLFSEHKLNEHRFIAFLLTSVLFSEHKLNEHRFIAVSFNFHFIKWPQTNLSWTHCILIYLMPCIALFLIIPIYRWHCVVSRFTGGILLFHDLPVALCCFTSIRFNFHNKKEAASRLFSKCRHGSSLVSFSSLISFPAYVNPLNNFSFNIFEFLWFRLPRMRVVLDIPICNKASVSVVYLLFLCSLPATNWPQRYNEDIVKKMTRKKQEFCFLSFYLNRNKMQTNIYYAFRTIPKSYPQILEIESTNIPNIDIH